MRSRVECSDGPVLGATFFPLGNVYGTLLNFLNEVEAIALQMHAAPYKEPPRAPILYVKPSNTWSADNDCIVLPVRVAEVEIGATPAMVMKAPGQVAGYVLMNGLRQPFGGTKASGTSREGGTWGYEVSVEPKNVTMSLGSRHIPHWDF